MNTKACRPDLLTPGNTVRMLNQAHTLQIYATAGELGGQCPSCLCSTAHSQHWTIPWIQIHSLYHSAYSTNNKY